MERKVHRHVWDMRLTYMLKVKNASIAIEYENKRLDICAEYEANARPHLDRKNQSMAELNAWAAQERGEAVALIKEQKDRLTEAKIVPHPDDDEFPPVPDRAEDVWLAQFAAEQPEHASVVAAVRSRRRARDHGNERPAQRRRTDPPPVPVRGESKEEKKEEVDKCAICMCDLTPECHVVSSSTCLQPHYIHPDCLGHREITRCPTCRAPWNPIVG